jgi:hypothetical protein
MDRLQSLLTLVPWLDALANSELVPDPRALSFGGCPYIDMKGVSITARSSADDVAQASFALMEQNLMTPDARAAWDKLRSIPERLKVDALLYRIGNVDAFRRLQQHLQPGAANLRSEIDGAPAVDGALISLLGGEPETAIAAWEKLLQESPHNVAVAHFLAIACFYTAQQLEARRD